MKKRKLKLKLKQTKDKYNDERAAPDEDGSILVLHRRSNCPNHLKNGCSRHIISVVLPVCKDFGWTVDYCCDRRSLNVGSNWISGNLHLGNGQIPSELLCVVQTFGR